MGGSRRFPVAARNSGYAAKPGRTRLRRREQTTFSFVKTRAQCLVASNRRFINHAAVIKQPYGSRKSP